MAEDKSKQRLGRGLAALIGDMERKDRTAPEEAPKVVEETADRRVPIERIKANRSNPRRHFAEAELEDLANSVREHGVVQPVLVRPSDDGDFELIAGERRWRAAQKAGLHEIPVVIRDVDNRQALELAIIENVQRADLNPVEEALGYQQLIDEHDYKQAELAKVIGKSRSHVANTLRLLRLPADVRGMLNDGTLSSGHARALIVLDDPSPLAKRIVREGLSVRETERLAGEGDDAHEKSRKKSTKKPSADGPNTRALEQRLSEVTGLKVKLTHGEKGKGRISFDYRSLEQLDGLIARLET